MNLADQRGPRISRQTRRLLATVLLSLAALWILARLRFPGRPPTPDPVAPLLTQIAPRVGFADLERALLELEPQLTPALTTVSAERTALGREGLRRETAAALRFRADAVLALSDGDAGPASPGDDVTLAARDRATGLAVLRAAAGALPDLRPWTAQRVDGPRYLIVTYVTQDRVALRPVFVGAFGTRFSPAWAADVWTLPAHAGLSRGTLAFTPAGAFVGLVAGGAGDERLVPAHVLLQAAARLLAQGSPPAGWLGVGVQALTGALRQATGLETGAVVTWVDRRGPAAGKLIPTDVILAVGGHPVNDVADWQVQAARAVAGSTLEVQVWRGDRREIVPISPQQQPSPDPVSPRLGLRMRARPGTGAEVLRVDDGSVAMRAGLQAGDIVTRIADIPAPTPAQVNRAFTASERGPLLALTRGAQHLVLALRKP